MTAGVIVTLDGEVHQPGAPLLRADDLAVLRGDGVFETLLVRDGGACLVESHLNRLAHSAKLMDLPAPDLAGWRRAIAVAVEHWTSGTGGDAALRLVCSRGTEAGTTPTAYAMITPVPDRVAAVRRDGVAAVTLDRGLPALGGGAADAMPWLLASAKTLSYAVNMAALRHAAKQGADDVIFISSDGYVLEGPRSTVVIATAEDDKPCLLTPPPWYPILRGTTQQALFEVARAKGYDCDYRALRPADLFAADGVWLVSSMTLAAREHTLDDTALPLATLAGEFAALVDAAVVSDR